MRPASTEKNTPFVGGRIIAVPRRYKDFGTWEIKNNCLVMKRCSTYEIYFDRCSTAFDVLDWILHYSRKDVTPEELADLVVALRTILNPQRNYRTKERQDGEKLLAGHLSKRME